jgi:hypothetical protein
MDWKQNKIIFNQIIDKGYIVEKDINTNDILYIKWEKFVMKCKYFLAFTVDKDNNIIWSCDNPYSDQKTKYFSQNIKNNLRGELIFSSQVLNNLRKLIHNGMTFIYNEDNINILWSLFSNYKKYRQFYIITEIIYL